MNSSESILLEESSNPAIQSKLNRDCPNPAVTLSRSDFATYQANLRQHSIVLDCDNRKVSIQGFTATRPSNRFFVTCDETNSNQWYGESTPTFKPYDPGIRTVGSPAKNDGRVKDNSGNVVNALLR